MKRPREDDLSEGRAAKAARSCGTDRLSQLSDELLLHILSFVPVATLNICQSVSRKLYSIAGDAHLWKAAYCERFGRRRAIALERGGLPRSSRRRANGKQLLRGPAADWKRQYRLRHNWSRGICAVNEIAVAEWRSSPPLLVGMHGGIVFTADAQVGVRAWSYKNGHEMLASVQLQRPTSDRTPAPLCMAVDSPSRSRANERLALGLEDGSFRIFELKRLERRFNVLYTHPPSAGALSALAYASPYLLAITERQLVSLYAFPNEYGAQDTLPPPRIVYSVQSPYAYSPLSLAIRTAAKNVVATIAYVLPTLVSGWRIGLQETQLTPDGTVVESRLAYAMEDSFQSLARSPFLPTLSPQARMGGSASLYMPSSTLPTSLSYSHPYLLASHPDNTLTVYFVTSTPSVLSVGPERRLFGHTSSVSGAQVGGGGLAVSVSRMGEELRLWDLGDKRSFALDEVGVLVRPGKRARPADDAVRSEAISLSQVQLEDSCDDCMAGGWVGFDDENVVALREKRHGGQALAVYDFR